MDVIAKRIENFIADNYAENNGGIGHRRVLSEINSQLDNISAPLDKVRFITSVLEKNNEAAIKHEKECITEGCTNGYEYAEVEYTLTNVLNSLGVKVEIDAFTTEEKIISEQKIDKILKDLEQLKMEHEIIYEDLVKEITELKGLYFLGKKTWYQLLLGKTTEMTISGVVSETISKSIVDGLKDLPKLLSEIKF